MNKPYLAAVAGKLAGDDLPPYHGGGEPPDDQAMEARVAKLEASLSHVERDVAELRAELKEVRRDIVSIRTTDFRLLFGATIAVALGLAGLMAKGFHWL